MAGTGAAQAPTTGAAPKSKGGGLILAVVYVTALFFIWAFVTNLIDPLVKSMRAGGVTLGSPLIRWPRLPCGWLATSSCGRTASIAWTTT